MTSGNPSSGSSKTRRPIFSRLGLLLLIVLCVVFVSSYTNRLARKAEIEKQIAEWELRIAEAELHQQELQAELDYVNSPAYIEDVARNHLDMAREGDTVIVVVPGTPTPEFQEDTGEPDVENAESSGLAADEPTWRQWFDLLLGE